LRYRRQAIPNTFAYIALFGWPAVCVLLFVLLPVEVAAIWSLLGGYLLLPSSFEVDLPMVPPIDKITVPAVSTLLLCWMKGSPVRAAGPSWLVYLFVVGYFLSPIFTSLDNSYELQTAIGSIPGFYPADALKLAVHNLIVLAPFYIGARYLCTPDTRALLLKSVVIAGMVYSLPMLFEVRMSPQLHTWVYGYFPHSFGQQIRDGGFRPVVFLEHGLAVALFASLAVIAAVTAIRNKWQILRVPAELVAPYLGIVLLLCKSLGALVYAILAAPIVLFTGPRFWTRFACALLLFVCAYPTLRWHGLIPVQQISSATASISNDRAGSFQFRAENEGQLLAKANEKPLLGWGTWGRNRVHDADTGRDISVSDGTWIIQYGMFGWFGYLSLFGLLTAAGFRGARAVGREATSDSIVIGGLTLMLAINVVDLLPNSNLTSLTFLVAGSVATAVGARSTSRSVARPVKRIPPSPLIAGSAAARP
jgi:hypothetical protein